MTVEDVFGLLEREVAPVKVSDDLCAKYRMYDNSGIIINCGNEVTGITFSLDLTEAAVKCAVQDGNNLIVTHHPAIYGGISRFDLKTNAHARALALCLKHDISVISMHLNFDAAPEGIDYHLMKGIGGDERTCVALETVDGGAYGRAYDILPTTASALADCIKSTFGAIDIILHGDSMRQVSRVASFCGAGCNDRAVEFAKHNGVHALVSSDLSHHHILELAECGITVIQLTHHNAEEYGFVKIYEKVKGKLSLPSQFVCNGLL